MQMCLLDIIRVILGAFIGEICYLRPYKPLDPEGIPNSYFSRVCSAINMLVSGFPVQKRIKFRFLFTPVEIVCLNKFRTYRIV